MNRTASPAPELPYPDKLRDPRWMKRKAEILLKQGQKCCFCQSQSTFVRHIVRTNLDPWAYPDDHYQVICPPCLKLRQPLIDELVNVLRMAAKDVPFHNLPAFSKQVGVELQKLQQEFKSKGQA